MAGRAPPVRITLGSVVLDRPDRTGRFVAKDLVGGWAYQVADGDGDTLFRGQGMCDGGLDVALRCAFLSAARCVPDCGHMTLLVESRWAHRSLVQLAQEDARVMAAIGRRPVAVVTRPQHQAANQVRTAAERAAALALRERADAERFEDLEATPAPAAVAEAVPPPPAAPAAASPASGIARSWRSWGIVPAVATAARLAEAAPAPAGRTRMMADWLHEFDTRVATVRADLHNVGA